MSFNFEKAKAPLWLKMNGNDLNLLKGDEWSCVYVDGNFEDSVLRSLLKKEINFYFPVFVDEHIATKSIGTLTIVPMFPGYIFCRTSEKKTERLFSIRHVADVLRTVAQEEFLEEIRAARMRQDAASEIVTDSAVDVLVGSSVKLLNGPFSGYSGLITGIQPNGVVSIELQGAKSRFTVHVDPVSFANQSPISKYRRVNISSINDIKFVPERPDVWGEHVSKQEISDFLKELRRKSRVDLQDITSTLIEHFRRRPDLLHELEPRKFEEFVAHLLNDMGAEVEITPRSRDKGRDVLAVFTLPIGKVLTVVECKKYAPDRPIGVDIVRSFMFTLNETDRASNGLIATTSRFTAGAREIESNYRWKLGLRDLGGIQEWIGKYGQWNIQRDTGLWLPNNEIAEPDRALSRKEYFRGSN